MSSGEFLAQVDTICSAYRQAVRKTGAGATSLVAQQNELSTLVGQTAAALKDLARLSPPVADAALTEQYMTLIETSVKDFVKAQTHSSSTSESVGTATEAADEKLAQTSAEDALAAQGIAHKLRLKVCGTPGAEWL